MNYLTKDLNELKNLAVENSLKYINAVPFPHIIIDDLFNDNDKKKAIDGFVTYLATEKLGDEVLKVLDSPMGSVEDHEGVVIRDEKIAMTEKK